MPRKFIINKSSHKLARKLLRTHPTPAEMLLWNKLQHKQLGFWFKRQVSIGKFIVDFYCPKKHLVIELDGVQHKNNDQSFYDTSRTIYLNSLNFKVIRFWNYEVINNPDKVLEKIKSSL